MNAEYYYLTSSLCLVALPFEEQVAALPEFVSQADEIASIFDEVYENFLAESSMTLPAGAAREGEKERRRDGEKERWGEGEMGRWGDAEMRRCGDGEMGSWGVGEMGRMEKC